MWERRQFLKAAGAGFAAALLPHQAAALANAELVLASACQFPDGRYGALLVSERGEIISKADLPDRGHGVTASELTGQFVVFARRPGTFAAVFDPNGAPVATITSATGRHFYGHGVFSPDGKLLYATENDFGAGQGVIGIYDATGGFARIGEFTSGGIGPHDMMMSTGGRYLVIANGGMDTHPDYGRTPLNLPTMQPNIAFIDRDNGSVAGVQNLPAELHKLSLRHLAPGPDDTVWIGAQYMGSGSMEVPLLARAGIGESLSFATLSPDVLHRLNNYVGALASSPDGRRVVATSPVGNSAVIFDSGTGQAELIDQANVCGVAWGEDRPILSSGSGAWRDQQGGVQDDAPLLFDNHLTIARRG